MCEATNTKNWEPALSTLGGVLSHQFFADTWLHGASWPTPHSLLGQVVRKMLVKDAPEPSRRCRPVRFLAYLCAMQRTASCAGHAPAQVIRILRVAACRQQLGWEHGLHYWPPSAVSWHPRELTWCSWSLRLLARVRRASPWADHSCCMSMPTPVAGRGRRRTCCCHHPRSRTRRTKNSLVSSGRSFTMIHFDFRSSGSSAPGRANP